MKAILSPCLFFNPQNLNKQQIQENTDFLSDTLNFIYNHLDIDLDKYDNSPYDESKWYEPNFEYEKLDFDSLAVNVYPVLLKLLYRNYQEIDVAQYENAYLSENNFIDLSVDTTDFLKYLNYLMVNDLHGIIFVGMSKKTESIDIINAEKHENYIVCDERCKQPVIRDLYLTDSDVFNLIVINPDGEDTIFPYHKLCEKFEKSIRTYEASNTLSYTDKIALYKKYFEVIAKRNGYIHSESLSRVYNRKYYINTDNTVAISCDTQHGGIEVFTGNHFTHHKGQFTFSCKKDKTETKKNKGTHKL